MDKLKALSDLTLAVGVTGNEQGAAGVAERYFKEYSGDVWRDRAGNVYARMGEADKKPTLLVMAHMDEVGMVVTKLEDNGMLRLASVAGVDPRVLPGSRVVVHGKEQLLGVVGAIPPHLLSGGARDAYKMQDLCCDVGLPAERVRELVSVGDNITFAPLPPLQLKNDRVAGKTLDDRALVVSMLQTMELLQKRRLNCNVVFCASVQEEKTGLGSMTGTYSVQPDIAIAMDVAHAPTPGTEPFDTAPMDKLLLTRGSNIHKKVFAGLKAAADAAGVAYQVEAVMGHTGTDAWEMQISRGGVPAGLISVPVRYMHTNVECLELKQLDEAGRLLAAFIDDIGPDWEEKLCWLD